MRPYLQAATAEALSSTQWHSEALGGRQWLVLRRVVGKGDRLLLRIKFRHREDRPEDLFARDCHMRPHIGEQRGTAVKAGRVLSSEGNPRKSAAIQSEATIQGRGNQRQSEAIRGNQRRSEAIRGDQRRSEAVRGQLRTVAPACYV